jgi:hypothetical protein
VVRKSHQLCKEKMLVLTCVPQESAKKQANIHREASPHLEVSRHPNTEFKNCFWFWALSLTPSHSFISPIIWIFLARRAPFAHRKGT